jgi:hypothetical protein
MVETEVVGGECVVIGVMGGLLGDAVCWVPTLVVVVVPLLFSGFCVVRVVLSNEGGSVCSVTGFVVTGLSAVTDVPVDHGSR